MLERDASGTRSRLIGSFSRIIAAARDWHASLAALVDPDVRVVTLTVTEKAYGIDRTAMQVDLNHPAVARDLADPHKPTGVLGLLTESLRLRRQAGVPPYTVLCCDNLPDNGTLLRAGVLDFARRIDPELADWIGFSAISGVQAYRKGSRLCCVQEWRLRSARERQALTQEIARHKRAYGHGSFVCDPLHYLALIEQKPNALDQARPLQGWALGAVPLADLLQRP